MSGVDGLSATTGHDGGGTAVRVHSLGLQASGAGLGCRFGSVGPVEATLVRPEQRARSPGCALCPQDGRTPRGLAQNYDDIFGGLFPGTTSERCEER